MQPQPDLNHTNRAIQNHQALIAEALREVQTEQTMADQRIAEGAVTGPQYYEQQADKIEQHVLELENELTQLQAQKERFEKRIAELEVQKAQLAGGNPDQLARIDTEIATLRGSSFML